MEHEIFANRSETIKIDNQMKLVREFLNDSEDDQNAYQEELNAAALATPAHIMIEEEQKIEEEKDHGERGVDEID